MTKVYLGIKENGSERGSLCIFVEIDPKSDAQEVLQECQKLFPYRLVEFRPHFNMDIVNPLINNGFEVIVNLDDVNDICKICRAAKIRLTLDISNPFLNGIQYLNQEDEIEFLLSKKEDIERLKNILGESLTRARVFVRLTEKAILTKAKLIELMIANMMPVSLEESNEII